MNRRGFLTGMGSLLAAPAIVRVGAIMPVKALRWPEFDGSADFLCNVGSGGNFVVGMWNGYDGVWRTMDESVGFREILAR